MEAIEKTQKAQKKSKKQKKTKRIILLVILGIIIIIAVSIIIYCYQCTHYWQADMQNTLDAGFEEKKVTLSDGSVINYAEGPDNGNALLLIHGQTGAWDDYTRVLPTLSEKWHIYAIDCYGHGKSSHNEKKYYLRENGDDLIWFVNNIIKKPTVVSGHSSGGLLASYVAAYGGDKVIGAVLEDPPVFSTEKDYFEKSFAYHDTYKLMHEYLQSDKSECWEAYYMRHCLWGQLYMAGSMDGLATYAQMYHEHHPDEKVEYFFMPEFLNFMFMHTNEYDMQFGEHFYDYSWHCGISHEKLMSDIKVPTVFIHCKDNYTEDGILLAASSDEQARKAVGLINDCELIELESNHDIHRFNPQTFIEAFERLSEKF